MLSKTRADPHQMHPLLAKVAKWNLHVQMQYKYQMLVKAITFVPCFVKYLAI